MIFGWSFQHSLLKKKFQSIDWQKNDTIIRVLSMHDLKMHFIFHHLQVQRLHSWVKSKVEFQINPLLLTKNLGRLRKKAHKQSAYVTAKNCASYWKISNNVIKCWYLSNVNIFCHFSLWQSNEQVDWSTKTEKWPQTSRTHDLYQPFATWTAFW